LKSPRDGDLHLATSGDTHSAVDISALKRAYGWHRTRLTTPKVSGSGQAGGLAHNLVKVSALAS